MCTPNRTIKKIALQPAVTNEVSAFEVAYQTIKQSLMNLQRMAVIKPLTMNRITSLLALCRALKALEQTRILSERNEISVPELMDARALEMAIQAIHGIRQSETSVPKAEVEAEDKMNKISQAASKTLSELDIELGTALSLKLDEEEDKDEQKDI